MSRFSDDGADWDYGRWSLWNQAVTNAISGKRGQAALADLEAADRVIAAAHRDHLAVRRPAHPIDRVVGHGDRKAQALLLDRPELDLAEAPRIAAANGERLAVRRERQ